MTTNSDRVADELAAWFDGVVRFCDATVFAVATDERHRRAAVLDVLTRNSRILVAGAIDAGGALYQPASYVLASTRKLIKVAPKASHWRAALDNVSQLRQQLGREGSASDVGLVAGTPAAILKDHFTEALVQAGVAGEETILDEENRKIALGLALNWGLRFLIAYALETASPASKPKPSERGLWWMHELIAPTAG